jgi:NAD(P)-dependent dehydrogenase (short-subunit alcohol dehydrogenase family)
MNKLFDIAGKVALVTGGSSGIGEMIAEGYAENGARVYICSRRQARCEEVARRLSARGTCVALAGDVSTLPGIAAVAAALAGREPRLDVLVNNAGASSGAPIDEYPEEQWDPVVDLNLKSVFFLTQQLLPLLRAAASPAAPARVINVASVHGLVPPNRECFAYSASKAGCLMLTRHLAKRLAADNILVNAIAPGPFESEMVAPLLALQGDTVRARNPLKRLGRPEEVAGVAIFLASRASAYTTGAVIPCDGGHAEL